jgi:hypothetical protein
MASTAVIPAGKANAQRPHAANIYKPVGIRHIQTGIPWVDGGSTVVSSKVDLSLPTRGFRLVVSGRLVIGTAAFASVNPEGLLNLLSNIKIEGVNSRQGGNVTLWDIDLATLFVIQHLFAHRAASFTINGVSASIPGTPFPSSSYINGATGTYDFRIVVDLPAYPFGVGAAVRPGFLIRQEEWADSIAVSFDFGSQVSGAVTGSLGVGASGTTTTFTAFGKGSGTPTVDLYVLPVQMGHLKDQVLPGIVSRTSRPLTSVLQGAGKNATLLQLQKQRTSRLYLKTGTATAPPAFATLDDTNVTAIGLQTGGSNRNVKPSEDIFAYKANQPIDYQREPIAGYTCLDFMESGNPDSSFPAQSTRVVGTGATFELVGDVTGEANGYGLVVQEQITHLHSGALYNY